MHRSVRTVCTLALWGTFSLIAVQAQNHTSYLLPGDEIEWKAFGKIDPWGLPPNTTKGDDKDGAGKHSSFMRIEQTSNAYAFSVSW